MKLKKYLSRAAAIVCVCLAALIAIPNFMTGEAASGSVSIKTGTAIFSAADLFTDRDLEQEADTSAAEYLTLSSGSDITITEAGVYVISGSAKECTICVDADDEKVQIVLDNVSVTNTSKPVIYVKDADKVFVTLKGENSLSVTGTFTADGSTNTDGVIFSKGDLVLNGTGSLEISSTKNGIVGKDDLKITGGTYVIDAQSKCIEANDSIRIAGGAFTLSAGTDALHTESDDADKGCIYICGGSFGISAKDDGIHATSIVQIDDGEINISAYEGIEGTYIQINGGTVTVVASDDGINAARKINAYTPTIEINGGLITITMGTGDTDGVDANGNIIINGGTVYVYAVSTFDYDGTGVINGGTVYVNGEQVTTLPNQIMGMGGWGGRGGWGQQGGWGNQGGRGGRGGW